MDCFDAFKPKYLCGILQSNVGKTEDREQVVIGCYWLLLVVIGCYWLLLVVVATRPVALKIHIALSNLSSKTTKIMVTHNSNPSRSKGH